MASNTRSDGDGSVYYVPGIDRWKGSLVVGWKDDKPVRRTVSAKSRAKASQRLRELKEKQSRGELPIGRSPTVEEWMEVWLRIAEREVRPSTLAFYTTKTRQYIIPLLGHRRLDKLRPEHVEQAWDELAEVGNPTKNDPRPLVGGSLLGVHRTFSRALTVAVERGYASRNVCTLIRKPRSDNDEIVPLSRAQARRVLEACRDTRNAARWSVALSLGLRQGEALGLTWPDVDLEEGSITIRRALQRLKGQGLQLVQTKSTSSRRVIVLPAGLLAELRKHRKRQAEDRLTAGSAWKGALDLVFAQPDGRPIDPRADWQDWVDLLDEADVPRRSLHNARHTAATLLLLQGVPTRVAMGILGHSQVSMTMNYQHLADDMQRDAAARMDAALWGDTGN